MNADVAQVILFQCCVDRLNRIRKLGTIIAAAHHQQSCNTSQNESLLCRTPSSFRCHKNSPFAPSTKGALQLVEKTLDSVAWRRNVRLDAAVEIHLHGGGFVLCSAQKCIHAACNCVPADGNTSRSEVCKNAQSFIELTC